MKNLLLIFIIFFLFIIESKCQVTSLENPIIGNTYSTPANISNTFSIKGIIVPTSPGSSSTAVYGSINSTTDNSGNGIFANHSGSGIGIYSSVPSGGNSGRVFFGSSTSNYGYYSYSENGTGTQINALAGAKGALITGISKSFTALGDVIFSGIGDSEGKVLTSDALGNASWGNLITRTGFLTPSSQADTVIDGTALKRRILFSSVYSSDILNNGDVSVFAKLPSGNVVQLPYSFDGQGITATLSFLIGNGRLVITCFTHDNSGSIPVDPNYQFQAIISPKKQICSGPASIFKVTANKEDCLSTLPCN